MMKKFIVPVASACAIAVLSLSCGGGTGADEALGTSEAALVPATPNFDITGIGIFGGMAFIQVAGTAGKTIPSSTSTDIYAYVYFTDRGTYALTSHNGKDSAEQVPGQDRIWHGHKIEIDASSCLTIVNDDSLSLMSGNKAYLVLSGSVKTFKKAQTVVFSKNAAGKHCVSQTFDTFTIP